MPVVRFRSRIPVPVEDLFAWHSRPGAFERLAPPWQRVDIVSKSGTIHDGDVLEMDFRFGPLGKRWTALHSDFMQDQQFRDTQVQGPFRVWIHTHRTHADGPEHSILDDEVRYEVPLGGVIHPLFGRVIHRELTRLFRYRHARTRLDLWRHQQYQHLPRRMVEVRGNHPLATQIGAFLSGGGHQVAVAGADSVIDVRGLNDEPAPSSITLTTGSLVQVCRGGSLPLPVGAADRVTLIEIPDHVVGLSFSSRSPLLLGSEALKRMSGDRVEERWVSEDDLIGLVYHAILTSNASGRIVADARQAEPLPGFQMLFTDRKFAGALITGRV